MLKSMKRRKAEVHTLLRDYPICRDSDFALCWYWLEKFGKFKMPKMTTEKLRVGTSPETLTRLRRIIQNKERKYRASSKARNIRRQRESEFHVS